MEERKKPKRIIIEGESISMAQLMFAICGKQKHQSLRPCCCGKKRKTSQCYWVDGYDSSTWHCKEGFGCKKITTI